MHELCSKCGELSLVCPPHLIEVLYSGIKDLLIAIPIPDSLC